MSRALKLALDLGSLGLLSSVILDTWLWLDRGYLVPCWTIAALSGGLIALFQVLKRQIDTEDRANRPRAP